MKMLLMLVVLFLNLSFLYSQDNKIDEIVNEGIKLHDARKYDEAIEKYHEALKLEADSPLANYEIALTYINMGRYDDAIYHCEVVIGKNEKHVLPSYIVMGSALNMAGRPDQAIEVYHKGIKAFPESSLLHYNCAYSYYGKKDYVNAEKFAINAIQLNPAHSSSHLILGLTMTSLEQRAKAILPLYYFLLLEPDSKRSPGILKTLNKLLISGIEKKSDGVSIQLPESIYKDSTWSAIETSISLSGATRHTETNSSKSDAEFFVENNKTILTIMHELLLNKSDLWSNLYVNKFYDLLQSNLIEPFSYYISKSEKNPEVSKWVNENELKTAKLKDWIDLKLKNQ